MSKIKRPQDIKDNERYRIVEGLHDGKEGIVVGQKISSFGFVWKELRLDNGEVISTRWSDLAEMPKIRTGTITGPKIK